MSADESYEYVAHHEFYYNNQPVLVSLYIEGIVLVAHAVCRSEILPEVGETSPLGIFYFLIPPFKRHPCGLAIKNHPGRWAVRVIK